MNDKQAQLRELADLIKWQSQCSGGVINDEIVRLLDQTVELICRDECGQFDDSIGQSSELAADLGKSRDEIDSEIEEVLQSKLWELKKKANSGTLNHEDEKMKLKMEEFLTEIHNDREIAQN